MRTVEEIVFTGAYSADESQRLREAGDYHRRKAARLLLLTRWRYRQGRLDEGKMP